MVPVANARRCARCGQPQEETFRFCPGCGLPTRTEPILSTQIDAARLAAQEQRDAPRRLDWRRLGVLSLLSSMALFVTGLGLVLFNPDVLSYLVDTAPPAEPAPSHVRPEWEPAWAPVAAGTYRVGGPGEEQQVTVSDQKLPGTYLVGPAGEEERIIVARTFLISKYEVTNRLWHEFLVDEEVALKEADVWERHALPRCGADGDGWDIGDDGKPRPAPDELDRPVRYVTPLAVAWFCDWLTRRIGDPAIRIRPPTRVEWEIAARGPQGQRYPWTGDYWAVVPSGLPAPGAVDRPDPFDPTRTNRYRPRVANIGTAQPRPSTVWGADDDRSPFGVIGLGSNVQELVLFFEPPADQPLAGLVRDLDSEDRPKFARVGGSFAMTAREGESAATAWKTDTDLDSYVRNPDLGVRLVKVRIR